jgi:hypothetical protein
MILALTMLTIASCGGGDDDSGDGGDGLEADGGGSDDDGDDGFSDEEITGQSSDFDLSSLPDDFPDELEPPDWETGRYTELTGFPTATFASGMSFDDTVAYYDDVHGESLVVGDAGERLAQWTTNPPWIISVFEGDPLTIGISKVPEE